MDARQTRWAKLVESLEFYGSLTQAERTQLQQNVQRSLAMVDQAFNHPGGAYDALAVEVAVEDFLRQRARAAPEPPPQEQQQQQQRHAQDLEEWLKWFGGDDSDDEADVISDADVTAFEEYFKQHPPDLDALAEQAEAMAAAGRGARRAHLNRRL